MCVSVCVPTYVRVSVCHQCIYICLHCSLCLLETLTKESVVVGTVTQYSLVQRGRRLSVQREKINQKASIVCALSFSLKILPEF